MNVTPDFAVLLKRVQNARQSELPEILAELTHDIADLETAKALTLARLGPAQITTDQSDALLHRVESQIANLRSAIADRDLTRPQFPRALDVSEAAAALSISSRTVRAWIAAGKLHGTRLGRRVVIRVSELERFLAEIDHDQEVQIDRGRG